MKKKKKKKITEIEKQARNNRGLIALLSLLVALVALLIAFIIFAKSNNQKTEDKESNENNIVNQNNISINSESYKIDKSKVKGAKATNNLDCDSDFSNYGKWEKDKWWKQDGQKFTYEAEELFGGPKMVFSDKKSSDNFLSSFEFMPVENINNRDKEINLVVYVGDLYKIVIEKIYKKNYRNEMESFDSLYVAYIKDDNKVSEYGTGAKIIKFENNISFDKWSKIKIVQESSEGLLGKTVAIEIFYFPDNVKDSSQDHEKHVFNLEDTSSFGTLQRDIKIGLQIGEKKSTFITKFNCFKLENR